ncbi:MAG: tRNA pseudouridine(55) synthase TruB [Clostridiales bacterium]|nr:tRNA pseudouridine(55) synthase TruB [Clostridiales bacterium]
MSMQGLVNVIKPSQMTSHNVVGVLRKLFNQKKIGHSGTLDPMATGVLNIFIGDATKLISFMNSPYKKYRAEMIFGMTSDTLDIWGKIEEKEMNFRIDEIMLIDVLNTFLGKSKQVPPMYSALKVNGKKMYELARKGIEIEREARDIEIKSLELIDFNEKKVIFDIVCTRGTYVRSLINDIGDKLGTKALMSNLIRLENESFSVEESYTLEELHQMVKSNNNEFLISMKDILRNASTYELPSDDFIQFSNGIPVKIPQQDNSLIKLMYKKNLVGIAVCEKNEIIIKKRFLREV